MNNSALRRATILGTLLQLAMILAGHYSELVRTSVFAVGGMAISFVAGALYARWTAPVDRSAAAAGGAISGGVCALIGILASVALGDTLPVIIVVGTVSSTVTGAIGGALLGGNRS